MAANHEISEAVMMSNEDFKLCGSIVEQAQVAASLTHPRERHVNRDIQRKECFARKDGPCGVTGSDT